MNSCLVFEYSRYQQHAKNNKNPNSRNGLFLFNYWAVSSHRPPGIIGYCQYYWLYPRTWWDGITEDTGHLGLKTRGNQADTHLDILVFWLTCKVLRCSAQDVGEESNHYFYPAADLQTNNEWPGKRAPLVQYYHGHHESNINLRMDLSPITQDENLTSHHYWVNHLCLDLSQDIEESLFLFF